MAHLILMILFTRYAHNLADRCCWCVDHGHYVHLVLQLMSTTGPAGPKCWLGTQLCPHRRFLSDALKLVSDWLISSLFFLLFFSFFFQPCIIFIMSKEEIWRMLSSTTKFYFCKYWQWKSKNSKFLGTRKTHGQLFWPRPSWRTI